MNLTLPNDPAMLLSFLNLRMRDYNETLDDVCVLYGADREVIEEKLREIDYEYDEALRQFV